MMIKKLSIEKDVLEQYKIILEDWIPKHAMFAIAVGTTYIYFSSGGQNIHLEIGSIVKEDSVAHRVLQTRMKTDAIMDNSLFDTPYYAIGYPIIVNNQPAALIIVLPPTFFKPTIEPYRFLTGKQNDDWSPIVIDHISHIESLQKRTWFYKDGEQYKTTITLKELQTRLPDTFIRIHRSYIINIYFIKKISRDLTSNFIIFLKDGTELPVSQSYMNDVRNVLEF